MMMTIIIKSLFTVIRFKMFPVRRSLNVDFLPVPDDYHWKFYKKDAESVPDEQFKWPFLDIFFYLADSKYMWGLSSMLKYDVLFPLDDIFPLRSRPFEHLYAAVPCRTEKIVLLRFGNNCSSPTYTHKDNVLIDSVDVSCKTLYNILPFVFRQKDQSGSVLETLKQGTKLMANVSIPVGVCGGKV